jgi:CubicO group peptidase (beta-lactamase class C family)
VIAAAVEEQSRGHDEVLGLLTRFGLGLMLAYRDHFHAAGLGDHPFGPHPDAFGHWGRGGSVGFADPEGRVAFGYVTNRLRSGSPRTPDLRWPALVDAVYASLGVSP